MIDDLPEGQTQYEGGIGQSASTAGLATPVCCGGAVSINVSEYCCPLEYGSIAFCEHCGKEVEGDGTRQTKEDAEQSAIEQWNLRIANVK